MPGSPRSGSSLLMGSVLSGASGRAAASPPSRAALLPTSGFDQSKVSRAERSSQTKPETATATFISSSTTRESERSSRQPRHQGSQRPSTISLLPTQRRMELRKEYRKSETPKRRRQIQNNGTKEETPSVRRTSQPVEAARSSMQSRPPTSLSKTGPLWNIVQQGANTSDRNGSLPEPSNSPPCQPVERVDPNAKELVNSDRQVAGLEGHALANSRNGVIGSTASLFLKPTTIFGDGIPDSGCTDQTLHDEQICPTFYSERPTTQNDGTVSEQKSASCKGCNEGKSHALSRVPGVSRQKKRSASASPVNTATSSESIFTSSRAADLPTLFSDESSISSVGSSLSGPKLLKDSFRNCEEPISYDLSGVQVEASKANETTTRTATDGSNGTDSTSIFRPSLTFPNLISTSVASMPHLRAGAPVFVPNQSHDHRRGRTGNHGPSAFANRILLNRRYPSHAPKYLERVHPEVLMRQPKYKERSERGHVLPCVSTEPEPSMRIDNGTALRTLPKMVSYSSMPCRDPSFIPDRYVVGHSSDADKHCDENRPKICLGVVPSDVDQHRHRGAPICSDTGAKVDGATTIRAAVQASSACASRRDINPVVSKLRETATMPLNEPICSQPRVFYSRGAKVTVIDEERKVFVIDLLPKETCDLIRLLTERHLVEVRKGGDVSKSWRTLYTYTKMDLPCSEVASLPWLTNRVMIDIIKVVGEVFGTRKAAAKLRPRSWKEPHLLLYQRVNGKPIHSGVEMHYDGCDITWQIMLSDLSEYEGGGTYFRSLQQTVKLRQGQVLVHPGELYHKGVDIVRGIRCLIVCFMDGFNPKILDDSHPNDDSEEYERNVRIY